jgi:hypothetical protein
MTLLTASIGFAVLGLISYFLFKPSSVAQSTSTVEADKSIPVNEIQPNVVQKSPSDKLRQIIAIGIIILLIIVGFAATVYQRLQERAGLREVDQQLISNLTSQQNTQESNIPSEDVCKLLGDAAASQILGVQVHGYNSLFDSSCVYSDDKKEVYLYLIFYRSNTPLEQKDYYLNDQYSKWKVQSHDEIQKNAFLVEQDALMKVFFLVGGKHYSIERSDSETRLITDQILLSLTKNILDTASTNIPAETVQANQPNNVTSQQTEQTVPLNAGVKRVPSS